MAARIAVIDDERHIREMVALHLRHHGYEVADAADGPGGLALVRSFQPDVIVLDVMMPKMDGLELLPHVRRVTQAPIIVLSAKVDVETRIAGLSGGADDYVPKPFDVDELLARIETRLRRPTLDNPDVLVADDLELDVRARTVRRGGRDVALSALEFKLLETFLRNRRHVLTRDQLIELVWGYDADVTSYAPERYVSYLRARLDDGRMKPLIRTVRGVGYVLDA